MDLALNKLQCLICHETKPGTIYGMNCFGHVMYVLQTSTNQDIAKLLT